MTQLTNNSDEPKWNNRSHSVHFETHQIQCFLFIFVLFEFEYYMGHHLYRWQKTKWPNGEDSFFVGSIYIVWIIWDYRNQRLNISSLVRKKNRFWNLIIITINYFNVGCIKMHFLSIKITLRMCLVMLTWNYFMFISMIWNCYYALGKVI